MPWKELRVKDATTFDSIDLIVEFATKYADSATVQSIVRATDANDVLTFSRNLFDYMCKHVRYQLDPLGKEMVWTPERLLREGIGDCKKLSTAIAAALINKGYPVLFKVISYDGKGYEHIYPIIPLEGGDYITLDVVNDCRFNEEIPHTVSSLWDLNGKQLDLYAMGGKIGRQYKTNIKRPHPGMFAAIQNGVASFDDDLDMVAGKHYDMLDWG